MTYGLQGGVVVHPQGITLSQPLGETIAIVNAQDAGDIEVQNRTGISTNSSGYAVVPYLTPYQRNRIQLDVESLGEQIDLVSNSATVIPTRGAVVYANFQTHIGWRALVKLTTNGQAVPFGAIATLESQNGLETTESLSGIVGNSGEVYISGLPEKGRIAVKWGDGIEQQCFASFVLPEDKQQPVIQVSADCDTHL